MYAQTAVQLHGAVRQVENIAGVELRRMRQTLETNWAQLSRYSGVDRDGTAGTNKDVEVSIQIN